MKIWLQDLQFYQQCDIAFCCYQNNILSSNEHDHSPAGRWSCVTTDMNSYKFWKFELKWFLCQSNCHICLKSVCQRTFSKFKLAQPIFGSAVQN